MNCYRIIFFALSFVLFSCATQKNSLSPQGPLAPIYNPPKAEEWKLSNGLTVLFMSNPELPMITGTLYTKGGSLYDSIDRPGIISAMGGLMRQGGAGSYSADQLDKKLDNLSAAIGTDVGSELGVMGFDCLSSDFPEVLPIFAQVVLKPRFENERIALWRGMALEGIRRRRDDADTVASLSFNQVLFDKTIYGKVISEKEVKAITRAELIEAHQKFIRPDDAILVVSGDIERSLLEKMLQENFAEWSPRGTALPPPPPIDTPVEKAIYFVQMPFEQSTVVFGQRGVPRLTPDAIAIEGFNKIFGTLGFSSRLMNRIRSELGLVYVVGGGISPGVVQGENTIYLQTKAASTGDAVLESLKILQSMQQGPILDKEMQLMKDTSINSFVFKFDSVHELIQRYALLRLLNYPADYDLKYIPSVSQLSSQDIQKVAQSRWDIGSFVYVVVGNETAYDSIEKAHKKENSPLSSVRLIKAGFDQMLELPANNP